MALLRYGATFDPILSLDFAGLEGIKGSNFAIWQHCSIMSHFRRRSDDYGGDYDYDYDQGPNSIGTF